MWDWVCKVITGWFSSFPRDSARVLGRAWHWARRTGERPTHPPVLRRVLTSAGHCSMYVIVQWTSVRSSWWQRGVGNLCLAVIGELGVVCFNNNTLTPEGEKTKKHNFIYYLFQNLIWDIEVNDFMVGIYSLEVQECGIQMNEVLQALWTIFSNSFNISKHIISSTLKIQ